LPGRWSEALPRYREAIARIEGRLVLAPLLPGLVVAHRVAVGAAAGATAHERDGGAAEAARLARACLAAFAAARAAGASSDETIDAGDGRIRRIDDLEAECRSAALTAAPLAEAVTRSIAAHREEWRRMLTGDRRRVFDEHPGALPEFPGPFAPRAARRARQWRYSSGGAAEVFTFRGDRLVESRKER
jgi:hypothetical protein